MNYCYLHVYERKVVLQRECLSEKLVIMYENVWLFTFCHFRTFIAACIWNCTIVMYEYLFLFCFFTGTTLVQVRVHRINQPSPLRLDPHFPSDTISTLTMLCYCVMCHFHVWIKNKMTISKHSSAVCCIQCVIVWLFQCWAETQTVRTIAGHHQRKKKKYAQHVTHNKRE